MPRRRNPECQRCAAQPIEEAQAKPCWNGQACHSRRSYYLKRPENKAKKRSRNRVQRVKSLDIPILRQHLPPEIVMTFYRDKADGPIHAVEFSVVDGGATISRVEAIHLKGVPQAKLRQHIQNVLGVLKVEFGQNVAVAQERQPAPLCPLCLKGDGAQSSE